MFLREVLRNLDVNRDNMRATLVRTETRSAVAGELEVGAVELAGEALRNSVAESDLTALQIGVLEDRTRVEA